LTEEGEIAVKAANAALAEVGFGLAGTDDKTAGQLAKALRKVRERLGDFG
jgi:hypothetical protein